MGLKDNIDKVDNKLKKAEDKIQTLEEHSLAMEILQYSKDLSTHAIKKLYAIIMALFVILGLLGGYFIYYSCTYGTMITTESAETDDGGNACVGDNCNNGDVTYGESN